MLESIDETIRVVRQISTELRPGSLDDLDLRPRLNGKRRISRGDRGVVLVDIPEEDLDVSREQATAFFRIFQEIITNVARHSKAGKVWVHSKSGTVWSRSKLRTMALEFRLRH